MALLGCQGLVIAVTHILSHRRVQPLLRRVTCLPDHGLEARHPRLEQGTPLGGDRLALLGANHERTHPVLAHAAFIGERLAVQQLHQAQEVVGLALMRRRR